MATKRKDNNRVVLRKGEGQRENGSYYFRWSDKKGNRHYIYAKTLEDLREQEKAITKEKLEGLKAEARYKSVNVPSPKKQTKNAGEKPNEKNDKYDIKLLYSTAFIPRFA